MSRSVGLSSLKIGAVWPVSLQRHVPAALLPGDRPGTEKRTFLASAGIRSPNRPPRSLVTVPTELTRSSIFRR